ncbi:MAG: serine/threonine protein kinase [Burkholderiaceae bacterium]|jgi:serine/threonine-protein kinase|nr:serine/threonine protein kinase [Burkholderiaceae bacterium]
MLASVQADPARGGAVAAADSDFETTVVALRPPPDPHVAPAPSEGGDEACIGRYRIERTLGTGGLGTVHEAWDPLLSRRVALKTLHLDADAGQRLALERLFLAEARAAAGLSHPHIVTVFDAGLSDRGVYIAMERLHGRDLRQALAEGWRPTPAQAVRLVRRVADALAYAHARGVVHCDVKPANIFLDRAGRPKLLDFGIARLVHARAGDGGRPDTAAPEGLGAVQPGQGAPGAASAEAAADGVVAGSPHYVAPEQLRGEAVDGRTDVHALGIVLYELLTGRRPYAGGTVDEIHAAVLGAEAPRADTVDPRLPASLAALAARAMARDPDARFASAAELAQALRRWQHDDPAVAADSAGDGSTRSPSHDEDAGSCGNAAGGTESARPGGDTVRPISRRRTRWASAGGVAIATLAFALGPWPGGVEAPDAPRAVAPVGGAAGGTGTVPGSAASASPGASADAAPTQTPGTMAAATTGELRMTIQPWGEVEVDGNAAGRAAPTATLTLPEGPHLLIVRHPGRPAFIAEVEVSAGGVAEVAHRFSR